MKRKNKKIRNILFMITSLYGGGAEKVCCVLASALAENYHVTVLYFHESEEQYPLDERCDKIRFPVITTRDFKSLMPKIGLLRRKAAYIRQLKKDLEIDVSISFLRTPNLLNVLSKGRERVITSERANPTKYQPEKFKRIHFIYRHSDWTVFQSETVRSLFGSKVALHSSVIHNPVSVPFPADEVRSRRVVSMGRLTEQKNHKMLIRAFAEFWKKHRDYTLSIYGSGELHQELEELIRDLGMEGIIILEGNRTDVHEQIRDAQIFVLSSNFEGLSNALLECMSMGIACISTACEGSTDVIRHDENGLLIPIGSEEELTKALSYLADDPEHRRELAEQAVKDSERFETEAVIRQWEELFFV